MRALPRLIFAIGLAAVALLPTVALATPSPSPSLDGVLAAPPTSDYVELASTTPGIFEGSFDAHGYVTLNGTPEPTSDQKTLENDGFLSGYGRTWVQRATNHVLVEAVLAFNGGDGADKWLRQSEVADKALPSYKSSLTVDGISSYYGEHLYDSSQNVYSDGFAMVKGNDGFIVVFASHKDDLGTVAPTQTKKVYDAAPDVTIPRSDWPSTPTASFAYNFGFLLGPLVLVALILGVIGFFVARSRRGRVAMVSAVQMSPDGGYWWDGQSWRDAQREAPPYAQRSADGAYWWDGARWRPMP